MKADSNVPYWLSRTELLLGQEKVSSLLTKKVLLVGLGGVGGMCGEMLVRGGIGNITLVDADIVEESNCNRQLVALQSSIGKLKVDVMRERFLDINPAVEVSTHHIFLDESNIQTFFDQHDFDYVVDCIDTLTPKVLLIKTCVERKIKIVSAFGAGGKTDATKVCITDIAKTYQCNLARYVRKHLHQYGIRKNIKVVFSPEPCGQNSIIETEKAFPKKSIIGTLSVLPNIFGCLCASVVLNDLIE